MSDFLKSKRQIEIYSDLFDGVKELEKSQIGEIFLAILQFEENQTDYEFSNPVLKAVFAPIKNHLKRKQEAYVEQCEYGKLGAQYGKLGGRPRKEKPPKTPTPFLETPQNPQIQIQTEIQTETQIQIQTEEKEKKIKENEFEVFWKNYPTKKGKGKAQESFKKAIKKTTLEKMLDSVEKMKLEKQKKEEAKVFAPEFPHPATWLNQERWQDEYKIEIQKSIGQLSEKELLAKIRAENKIRFNNNLN
jgi:hypothetical protein